MSILDAFKYPFSDPAAQQLHIILCQLNPTGPDAILAAEQAGLNTGRINSNQAPLLVWADILRAASPQGLTRTLVEQARSRLSPTSPFRKFLDALLAGQSPPTEGEPRAMGGAPLFLEGSDTISKEEALLYRDDLMIEIGRVPALIATLQNLVTLAPAVCKLSVDVEGYRKHGTGFRIDSDMLLTNWHVLHRGSTRATAVTAEFNYEDNGKGGGLASKGIKCDVSTIVTDETDDWGVIRAKEPLEDAWPVVKLSDAVAPQVNSSAYIVQHPGGDRKRLGFVRNQVCHVDNRVIHYLTDTKEGSSGSPVFNDAGGLIALHSRGGQPQAELGKEPMKKNEGVRISRIVEGLKAQNVTPA